MAPVEMFNQLLRYYRGESDKKPPVISTTNAALLSVFFTLIYVLPFYLSKSTRPSPSLNRDAPSVIRARVQAVTFACILASTITLYLLITIAKVTPREAIHLLGWWPINPLDIIRSCCLVILLYTGPLFEIIFIERNLRGFHGWHETVATLTSWMGYRNFIVGPITEEIIFRSVILPLQLLAQISPSKMVFFAPLYFGIAHLHHLYEFKLTHPYTPWLPAIFRSLFQFGYTTVFGWFASFIYLRTGSIYPCIIIHSFCNWAGLPRFWGRPQRGDHPISPQAVLRGKDDTELPRLSSSGRGGGGAPTEDSGDVGNVWMIAYYVLLIAGAYAFYSSLWPLSDSTQALASFATGSARKT